MPTVKATVTNTIEDETIRNLLCCALEGGSNYWYMHTRSDFPAGVDYDDFEKGARFGNDNWSWPYLIPFTDGCALIMTTEAAGDEGDKTERRLDKAALYRGLQVMAEKYPRHFADVVSGNEDAGTGDVFLQCCLLGEIVYG